ncbi:restriction endonuclease subunit S [uncultured Methanobrevibacter sp.]|uniref:restriction endonuclease subunit S n=1 Tax=uncultured Methanobrevibacter sp. TaxID=253161 RepID=UPI0025E337CF|nr:restriction endonuclease subunit S [uncultured Methanobrevibacter sp.]
MSLEFDYQKLGSISDVKGGKRLPKRHSLINIPNSHPYIKVKDMAPDKLLKLTDNFEYIENETFNEISQYIVNKGDLIISIVGTIGLTNIIEYSLDNANLTENCAKITNLKKGYNVDYIYYFLNSKIGQNLIQESTVGAVQKKLPIKNIRDLNIPFPDFDIQNKIVDLLSTIDKKIENCKSINKNLFELSNVIYSDFIKSMDNNEQCHYIELKELGNIVMGQSPKGESYNYDNIGLPLINGAADYENGYLKAQKYTSDPKKTCNKNDLIFCIRATIGLLVVCDKKYCLGRGVAGITNINPIYKEYAFHLINSSIENFKRAATGSVISGISRKDIENIDVIIPSSDEINKYHTVQKPIFDKLENNRIEINNLIKLRDTLLPKLMSGEIDVSKINCDLK